MLTACSFVDEHPLPSTEAKTVVLTEDVNQLKQCQKLRPVIAYGTFEDEVRNDLRHQAATNDSANTVLLNSIQGFYQTTRLENYLRIPEMKAPKGTAKYYYQDAFTLKAKGISYLCP